MDTELQRTDDWFAARLGKVTASRISDVLAKGRSGAPSATRANYKTQLLVERLTGQQGETYTNAAMQWGIDNEADARLAYEFMHDKSVELVGFIDHPTIAMAGASPDGLIGDDGLVEIKCPNTNTHIETFINKEVEGKYIRQMQWQMACTGRQWCDYVSYDPRLKINLQLFVKRIPRDNEMIAEMETAVIAFLEEVDNAVGFLEAA